MPMTPASSFSAYCTPAQMLLFYDKRLIGMLASDTDGVVITPTNLLTDATLAAALAGGAGDVEAACAVAGRYTQFDLQRLLELSGGQISVGGWKLIKLNADLAFATMRQRRGYKTEEEFPQLEQAWDFLKALRLGERIFSFAEVEDAGTGTFADQGAVLIRRIPLPTTVAYRHFGRRGRDYRVGGLGN